MNGFHEEILELIKKNSGKATQHTFLDGYLGNEHPRYPISAPVLRRIAKEWMSDHCDLSARDIQRILTSLIKGKSSTEKCMAGILLDVTTKAQRKFDPASFDLWLDHLVGWAEVDSVCTGPYSITEIPNNFTVWKSLLLRFSKSKNINKRRASLVLLCSPTRTVTDARLARVAFQNIDQLKLEKEILITKAISWLLRSMVKNYRTEIVVYLKRNGDILPKIAIRETLKKLRTGKKT